MVLCTFSTGMQDESLDLDESMTVGPLCEMLGALLNLPPTNQGWVINGRSVLAHPPHAVALQLLRQSGFTDGGVVMVLDAAAVQQHQQQQQQQQQHPTSSTSQRPRSQRAPVSYPGMRYDEILHYNPNPLFAAQVFRNPANAQALQELGFHIPSLASAIRSARTDEEASTHIRSFMIERVANSSLDSVTKANEEQVMTDRLKLNPNDAEAKAFFDSKQREALVNEQYQLMMEEYPETMMPVLPLYIECFINGKRVCPLVDTGAQTSVMTKKCAIRCGIHDLIDGRFKGELRGVGSSTTLGKIHLAPLQIAGQVFPISVTIVDDDKFGDKAMDLIFGLDTMKRFKCGIDLNKGRISFHNQNGHEISAEFLHEKDLPKSKGGVIDDAGFAAFNDSLSLKPGAQQQPSAAMKTASAPASAVQAPPPPVDPNEAKLRKIMSMGYNREQAARALQASKGDVETAKTILMFEPKRG